MYVGASHTHGNTTYAAKYPIATSHRYKTWFLLANEERLELASDLLPLIPVTVISDSSHPPTCTKFSMFRLG